MKTITIKDIAKECGVGVATVSRALNDHPDINPETKKKIIEVVEKYGFVPNSSARNLKITASNSIAVLVKGISNPFFMKMIGIMEEDIQSKGYSMELRHIDERTDEVDVAIDLIREKKLQGIVFLGGSTDGIEEKLEALSAPCVLSTFYIDGEKNLSHSSVSVDDESESYKITKYLLEKGHRKIALMAADRNDTGICRRRLAGYARALKEFGLEPDDSLIWYADEVIDSYSISISNGYKVMKKKVSEGVDVSAVYAISDTMAIGAIRALTEAGRRVPDDVSVAGFDGIELGRYCVPSITTVSQPFEKMAHETTKALFDVIEKNKPYRKVLMEAEITERESVKAV